MDKKFSSVSRSRIVNEVFQVKVDYQTGRGYTGFVLDGVQLILLAIGAFTGVSWLILGAVGVSAILALILIGRIARVKGFIQRETGKVSELNPIAMETLEAVRRIEKAVNKPDVL